MTHNTRLSRSLFLLIALLPNSAWAIDWTDAVLGGIELLTRQEVDYAELINAPLRQNATPENNFFAVLLQYVPDDYLNESKGPWVKRFCDELGCPVPVPGRRTIEWFPANQRTQLSIALSERWDPRNMRQVDEWLKKNEAVLDEILGATSRPVGYRPVISPGGLPLLRGHTPDLQVGYEISRLGTLRVMRSLYLNDLKQAHKDLLSLHRLASLVGQRPSSLTQLKASYFTTEIFQVAQALYLTHPAMTPASRFAYFQNVSQFSPPQKMVEVFRVSDALMKMEAIEHFLNPNPKSLSDPKDSGRTSAWLESLLIKVGLCLLVDRDEVLVGFQEIYMEIADILNEPYGDDRNLYTEEIVEWLKDEAKFLRLGSADEPWVSRLEVYGELQDLNRLYRSRRLGQLFAASLTPPFAEIDVYEQRALTLRAMLPALVAGTEKYLAKKTWPDPYETLQLPNGQRVGVDPVFGEPFFFSSNPENTMVSVFGPRRAEDEVDSRMFYRGLTLVIPIKGTASKTERRPTQIEIYMPEIFRWPLITFLAMIATAAVSYPLWLPHWQRRRMAGVSTFEEDSLGDPEEE